MYKRFMEIEGRFNKEQGMEMRWRRVRRMWRVGKDVDGEKEDMHNFISTQV